MCEVTYNGCSSLGNEIGLIFQTETHSEAHVYLLAAHCFLLGKQVHFIFADAGPSSLVGAIRPIYMSTGLEATEGAHNFIF